jgi:hypothetical protein
MNLSLPACRPVPPRCCLAGDVDVVLGDDREAVGAYLQERDRQERRWEEQHPAAGGRGGHGAAKPSGCAEQQQQQQ